MRYYPVNLDLKGRKVVVVGGGAIAWKKIRGLLRAGAEVTVIDRHPISSIKRLAEQKKVHWLRHNYRSGDLGNAFAAIAATNDTELHGRIHQEARKEGVLLNVVDQPKYCDFIFPSVLHRGEFIIAVSTGGNAPALAKEVRKQLEDQFGPEYGRFVKTLASLRRRLPAGWDRQKIMKKLVWKTISRKIKGNP